MPGYVVKSDIASKSTGNYVTVERSKLDNLRNRYALKFRDAIQKTASDIHANSLAIIREKNLIDTGNLLNSIFSYSELDGYTAYVVVGAFYGIYLEYGTVRMSARPFLGPATEQAYPGFVTAIKYAMVEAAREG